MKIRFSYRKMILGIFSFLLLPGLPFLAAGQPGKILWKYEFKRLTEGHMSRASVSGNRVIVSMGMGDIICLDINTGKVLWQKLTSNPNRNINSPKAAIWNNRVYLQDNTDYTKGIMQCLELGTGRLLWKYRTPQGLNPNVKYGRRQSHSDPLVRNGRLYFNDYQGVVYCLNALTGSLIWKTDINVLLNTQVHKFWSKANNCWMTIRYDAAEMISPVYIDGNYILSATKTHILCLNLADGSKNWIQKFEGKEIALLGAFGGRTFMNYLPVSGSVSRKAHNLMAFNTASGRLLWKSPRIPGTETHSLQLLNGHLDITGINALFGSPWHQSYFTRININTGRFLSLRKLWFSMRSYVMIVDGRRYYYRWDFHGSGAARSFDYLLYCEDASTGRFLWKTPVIIKSYDWYYTGSFPKSRHNELHVKNGRAFVTIKKRIYCIQVGNIATVKDTAGTTDSGNTSSSGSNGRDSGSGVDGPGEGE